MSLTIRLAMPATSGLGSSYIRFTFDNTSSSRSIPVQLTVNSAERRTASFGLSSNSRAFALIARPTSGSMGKPRT